MTTAREARLEAALRQWQCGSCGGTGLYKQHSKTTRGVDLVKCTVCDGRGLNPIAAEALKAENDHGTD